jgi:two-component system phosphate regulon response regulator OmpR
LNQQQLYHLLVVDDDRRLRGLLEKYLSDHGFLVTAAASAAEAREIISREDINLIVLDLMMPQETGLEFTEKLRKALGHPKQKVPILILTALSETHQRIEGLEKGADDYLTKPFEPKELLLRIQRILERSSSSGPLPQLISLGNYQFDPRRKVLLYHGEILLLTSAEQKLLDVLAANPRVELSREELAAHTGVPLSPRTIDVQVTRLRRKIEDDPKQPRYLRTVRHKGYALYPDD